LAQVIFITGTDTGAGKTLLTALLLHDLRQHGCHALAINPFCFQEPVAPLVAARNQRRRLLPGDVMRRIRAVQKQCECLLVEGSGGLMTPLGETFCVADLITALDCPVVVAARNKLGVINHTLLTAKVLALYGVRSIMIALLGCKQRDSSARTNAKVLGELLSPVKLVSLPYLGDQANTTNAVKKNCKKVQKTLALILDFAKFTRPGPLKGSRWVVRKMIDSRELRQ
jgi:dethiobiotin synthetase